jgi:AmmeMemoRadiSam system protein A
MEATSFSTVDAAQRGALLEIAVTAIEAGLAGLAGAGPPGLAELPTRLALAGSSFVSLHSPSGLRGCCGTLEPSRALAVDVWRNARASAFADPRFAPLAADEWRDLAQLEIALLSGFERLDVRSEAELLDVLAPAVDGLVLGWQGRRATFLPKVWEQVAGPRDFVARLKEKAGWATDFWARDMDVVRYRTECIAIERPGSRERAH